MPTTIKKFLRCYPKSLTMHAYRDDSEVHIQFRTCIEPAPAPGRCNGLHIEHTSRMVLPRPSSLLYKTIIVISVYAGWLLFQQWLVPGHCNIVQVNEPSPLNPVSTPSTPSHKSLSDYLFPRPSATNPIPIWTATNHEMIANMFHCIESNTCAQNQTTVVILSSHQFRRELVGDNSGEKIWARSVTKALKNMGYTYIYTWSNQQTVQIHEMFPGLVKMIIMDDWDVSNCVNDIEDCILTDKNPTGIPSWKLFVFNFWSHNAHPLGSPWNLSPEDYSGAYHGNNSYVGYSVEELCRTQPFIPHSEREDKAYVLAKSLSLFTPEQAASWSPAIFDAATAATGITYTLGSKNDSEEHPDWTPQLPSQHENFGIMEQAMFLDTLSRSKVLIGMGNPITSPTPYDALCLGVPFINPIVEWDHDNPGDRSKWYTQHEPLSKLGSPYVYNVFKNDTEGFVRAIEAALENPIESSVLDRMRLGAVERRLGAILEHDWEAEASSLSSKPN